MTVLAAIYLPLSLASSIFGMNVREIDAERNRIWQFAVLALGIAAITALAWWIWRICKNARALMQYLHRQFARSDLPQQEARNLDAFLKSQHMLRSKRLQYLLGLRSIEKSGIIWDR